MEVYPTTDALIHAAAERIAALLDQTLRKKETVSLVLTGGKTPKPVYELLASPLYLDRIDWNRIRFFWGDERCVPPDSPDSNFGMAWNALLSKLEVPPGHIHRMKGEMEDAETAASLYQDEIRKIFPAPGTPSFDLVLLGMGADGHVASLFPGTKWDEGRLVVANHVPQTGARRISMTPPILNEGQQIIFLIAGKNKSEAVAEVLRNPSGQLPASRIHPVKGSLTWMLDSSAALLIRDSKFEIRD